MRPVCRALPSKPQWERLAQPAEVWGGGQKAGDKYREMREGRVDLRRERKGKRLRLCLQRAAGAGLVSLESLVKQSFIVQHVCVQEG